MKKALFIICIGLLSLISIDGFAQSFFTRSDTLTIQTLPTRRIQIFPGWNDVNTGEVLYVSGNNLYHNSVLFPDKSFYHADYNMQERQAGYEELVGYAVDIPHLKDAFALEYILVRYIDGLQIPGISVPMDIKVGEDFTVTLTGTPHLMTSWIPEISISGVDAQFISRNGWVYTYRAKTAGTMSVKLHHNSLQVLSDTTVTRKITTSSVVSDIPASIKIYPNPTENVISIISTELQIENISIYDVNGEIKITQFSNFDNIDLNNLPLGTYFLQIQTNVQKFHTKFSKIK